jgi:peptide/nickel transport system permease protein
MSAAKAGGSLRRYMVTRVLLTIPMLFILLTVVFLLLRVAPGDPIRATLGDRLSPAELEARSEALGFNDPLIVQYGRYLGGVVTGDLGDPITDRRTTLGVIRDTFPATLELTLFAMVVAIGVGVVIGAVSGRLRDTPFDVGGRLFGILIYAAPIFWLGLLAQLTFSLRLGWFPTGSRTTGFDAPREITGLHVVDSIITLDPSALAEQPPPPGPARHDPRVRDRRHLRAAGAGQHAPDAALRLRRVRPRPRGRRADGAVPPRLQERARAGRDHHRAAVRAAARRRDPDRARVLVAGMGTAILRFLEARDYVGVQGIVTFFAIVVVIVSLLIDLINGLVDPRIRY